jgi:hypothetical protein
MKLYIATDSGVFSGTLTLFFYVDGQHRIYSPVNACISEATYNYQFARLSKDKKVLRIYGK